MAGIVVLALLITTSLSVIEAKASNRSARRDGPVDVATESCVPGKFYRGPGCGKCFCTAAKKKVCSPPGTCKLSGAGAEKIPTTHQLIRTFNRAKLYLLTSLPNTGSECTPGKSYRVDCNRCLCVETKSLVCENLLCPEIYNDFNKQQAVALSGKPCKEDDYIHRECVTCSCEHSKYACKAKADCISSLALLKFHRTTEGPLHATKSRHHMTLRGKLPPSRPRGDLAQGEIPFDEAFLDPNNKCTPGVIYHYDCNKCTCSEQRVLGCTTMLCMKYSEAPRLLKRTRRIKKLTVNRNDMALLKKKAKCVPGTSFRDGCKSCYCTKNRRVHCTRKECLKAKITRKIDTDYNH